MNDNFNQRHYGLLNKLFCKCSARSTPTLQLMLDYKNKKINKFPIKYRIYSKLADYFRKHTRHYKVSFKNRFVKWLTRDYVEFEISCLKDKTYKSIEYDNRINNKINIYCPKCDYPNFIERIYKNDFPNEKIIKRKAYCEVCKKEFQYSWRNINYIDYA